MSDLPKKGRALPVFTDKDFNDSFDALFTESFDVETKQGVSEAATGFINLTLIFISRTHWKPLFNQERLSIDSIFEAWTREVSSVEMLRGQQIRCKFLEVLKKSGKLNAAEMQEIIVQVKRLGLRITSDEPRKTKIVAAFALWFSTLRLHLFSRN